MIRAEQEDEDGNFVPVKRRANRVVPRPNKPISSKNQFDALDVDDSDDDDFEATASDASSSESDSNDVSMQEVFFVSAVPSCTR